LNCRPTV